MDDSLGKKKTCFRRPFRDLGEIRTHDRLLRRQLLYPTELPDRWGCKNKTFHPLLAPQSPEKKTKPTNSLKILFIL